MKRRSFLFLQGPPGPFFRQLATRLETAGHACHRINLNGGDAVDWKGPANNFTRPIGEWSAYLAAMIAREAISDIVLFGDCRVYHVVAREMADAMGLAVHVFEEGYIRPDWVTCERGGVNGNSSLPREAAIYRALAATLPDVPVHPYIPASFRDRALEAARYFMGCLILGRRFPVYIPHRPYPVLAELKGWARRLVARPLARLRSTRALATLGKRRFFLLPLQLDSDHQIRIHSPFTGMHDALATILASFAAHAPEDVALLVKEHPLDNGLHDWRGAVTALARALDIEDRLFFIEHGDLYSIVEASVGVVTVNSTTGTLALTAGIPVIVLGTAIYNIPGITHQTSLDQFWTAPEEPDAALYEAFRRVLVVRCLLRGGFSSRAGRDLLLPAATDRLLATPTAHAQAPRQELAVA